MAMTEIRDIAIAVAVLSFAFYNALGIDLLTSFIVITLVFLSHELGHRFLARRYGCFAEFTLWTWGIILAIATSFTGIIFAAPGAVYISPFKRESNFAFRVVHLTKKEYGKISLAGPAINIAIGAAAFAIMLFSDLSIFPIIMSISFFLALFNLLPIQPLDGSKVLAWDKRIWAAAFAASAAPMIAGFLL